MAIKKYRWTARFGFSIGAAKIKFVGRERFVPASDADKKAFLDIGVFSEDGNSLYYSAPVKLTYRDGTKVFIDPDGIIQYDDSLLPSGRANKMAGEMEEQVP